MTLSMAFITCFVASKSMRVWFENPTAVISETVWFVMDHSITSLGFLRRDIHWFGSLHHFVEEFPTSHRRTSNRTQPFLRLRIMAQCAMAQLFVASTTR